MGFFRKEKTKDKKNPSWLNKVKGEIGYREQMSGLPDLEFMEELSPPDGLEKFRRMRNNDPIVGGLMLQIENIMRHLRWTVKGENEDFIIDMLNGLPGGVHWLSYNMSSCFTYGFFIGEMIWQLYEGKLWLIDVAPRFQTSVAAIKDDNDNIIQETSTGRYEIPYKKCIHHVVLSENRSPYGVSILRHLYKPYYYKVSIEASESVGIDRDLSGMPVMTAPEGFNFLSADPESPDYDPQTAATLDWALDIVSNVRKDNVAGIVKPYGWTLEIVRGENRTSIPTSDIISRYNTEMAAGVLENFLSLGAFATTNNANTEVNVDNFLKACDAYAAATEQNINDQIIKPICMFNDLKTPPKFSYYPVSSESLESLASFFSRLTSNGLITPTTTLERELLEIANFSYDDREEVKKKIDEG